MQEKIMRWKKRCTFCTKNFTDEQTSLMGSFIVPARLFKTDTGICPSCQEKLNKKIKENQSIACLYWTFDSVKEYFVDNPPYEGQELLIHDTSGNMNTYALVKVVNPESGKQKRIVVENYSNGYSGKSFYRTGKNCFAPTGQVRLLPYNARIGELIKASGRKSIILKVEQVKELIGKADQTEKE